MTEGIEPALLRAQATRGGARCLALEFAMHPLVGAVLLRTRRRDALTHDTELHPPDIQCRQAVNARGGERRAVVGTNGVRQSYAAEEGAEDGLRVDRLDGAQAVAHQHAATEMIRHRQGIAVLPVAHTELAFEVRGPDLIGTVRRDGDRAGMHPLLSAPTLVQQRVPLEDRVHRTPRRPRAARVPGPQHPEQFLRAPAVLTPRGDEEFLQCIARTVRTPLRRTTAVGQTATAAGLIPREPLVARGAGDTVPLAQLGHRPVAALEVVHKREPFLDDIRFHPGHPPGVNDARTCVNYDPDLYRRHPNTALHPTAAGRPRARPG